MAQPADAGRHGRPTDAQIASRRALAGTLGVVAAFGGIVGVLKHTEGDQPTLGDTTMTLATGENEGHGVMLNFSPTRGGDQRQLKVIRTFGKIGFEFIETESMSPNSTDLQVAKTEINANRGAVVYDRPQATADGVIRWYNISDDATRVSFKVSLVKTDDVLLRGTKKDEVKTDDVNRHETGGTVPVESTLKGNLKLDGTLIVGASAEQVAGLGADQSISYGDNGL